jgi:hypothetical protein
MEYVYHIVAIRVNETSWVHLWRLRSRYLGTGCDSGGSLGLRAAATSGSVRRERAEAVQRRVD